jgi:ketosteroid isomerase-like protein
MDELESTLQSFLGSFSRLELENMIECFDEDATAFFPSEHKRERVEDKKSIRAVFLDVIAKVRRSGVENMKLTSEDVKIQRFGDIAIVTFQIRSKDLSRRTFVFKRELKSWFVVHMHASNAPIEDTTWRLSLES